MGSITTSTIGAPPTRRTTLTPFSSLLPKPKPHSLALSTSNPHPFHLSKPLTISPNPNPPIPKSTPSSSSAATSPSSPLNLKSRLRNGETLYGLFLLSFSPTLAEIAGHAGYDFVVVDMEHGPGGIRDALPCLHALAAANTAAILRVPESTAAWAKKALDLGPQGLMFPMIESPLSAQDAVSYCRFPPTGLRGAAHPIVRASKYGLDDEYLGNYLDELLIMCQVESEEGVANTGAIAAVDGVDCVQMGRFATVYDGARDLRSRGYHMVSGAVDVGLFRSAAVEDVTRFKMGGDGSESDEGEEKEGDEKYWKLVAIRGLGARDKVVVHGGMVVWCHLWFWGKIEDENEKQKEEREKEKRKVVRKCFPWWCVMIGGQGGEEKKINKMSLPKITSDDSARWSAAEVTVLIVSTGFLVHSMSESEKWVGVADEVVARKQRAVWLEYSVKRARAAASPPGCSENGYAPQVGLAEHFKVKFWEDLEGVLQDIPQGEKVFLGGDLNGHVGSVARGFEGVHGGFGLGEMNGEGKSILEFSEALNLSIANTWFKKREEHLITYKSGGTCSQIDFFLIRKSDRKYCLNCKVIPGESLTTQHRVLVMDGEKQGIFQQKIWEGWCGQSQGSANDMWNKMSQEIIKVAKETLGESRGFGPRGKESWWWNENVQSKVRAKKECFKEWSRCRNSETWDKYKIARNETKKAVSEARAQAFDGLYQALGTRDGERSIYRLAKGKERKTRDLDQVKCVKDEEGKVLVHEKDIKERWKAYFHNLFNDGYGYDSSSLDTREEDRNYKYYRRIQKQEVKEALKRMSNGKAVGPDNIPIEVWKTLGDRGLEWLTELFNEIMRSKRMPEEWRRSTLVPIYKNKGDIQNCANYRGIKLMSHTMKLWERVIERRLRKETQVTENQFGFMPGRSTMEAIYLLRRVMEQYRMAQQDLHLIFIDLEKAYDRVPREILWKALEKKGVRVAYIRAIQDMYDRVSTSVRTQGGESDDFPITIGLHQGSTLSPYLFTLILDVLTEQIQEIAPRCMLFADDIVLLGESREELNERLETWRRALETHGFRLSRSKSEYMECKFNKRRRVSNSEVKIGDHIIPQVTRFKYLGSVIQDDGEIEGDVNHRIQAGWMKWRKASGVLCDAKVPIKLKGKFYRTAVRPAILYGTECWAVKSQHENKVGVAEMRMLRWMCGKTRQDKIRNEAIRERVGVAPIVEKMVENRLRWFGHVERRPVDSVVRRVDQMERRQTIRGRGRPKKTIREVIKKDLELNDLDRSMILDRTLWRKLIHVADPT
ncbi:2-keto-3-deoxy-L-rhamnonate aldolase [Glycine soja]|uniref:2-keto-3-deoxy-L-rhamnonate aldolase n=1 Tax=Glycine soja TaxID=3848 RepID=A0A445JXN6_GLYSO|nr:2-keto-3-deoxy-L-rhamnonate aldolase [Glycine soja]